MPYQQVGIHQRVFHFPRTGRSRRPLRPQVTLPPPPPPPPPIADDVVMRVEPLVVTFIRGWTPAAAV